VNSDNNIIVIYMCGFKFHSWTHIIIFLGIPDLQMIAGLRTTLVQVSKIDIWRTLGVLLFLTTIPMHLEMISYKIRN
jgi:hypothetical protein